MTVPKRIFDAIVFSGGGFKGAYGAGAAKAIMEYYQTRNVQRSVCFIGNSAGALNAAVMAASSVDDLIHFWLTVSREQVLGRGDPGFLGLVMLYLRWRFSRKKEFFFVYPGEPRRNLINSAVSLDSIINRNQHLIIAATDFVYAESRAFFSSQLMTRMKTEDDGKPFHDQRLTHCGPIQTQEELVLALLGSTAIPLAFPPVEIKYQRAGTQVKSFFVDGGVGNNVPTREAAYFLRRLEDLDLGQAGDTYCIKLSPARVVADKLERGPASILLRTYDVYDYIHMGKIVAAWHRINREIDRWGNQHAAFEQFLNREIQDPTLRAKLSAEVCCVFRPRQHQLPLFEIEPSQPLGETLDFSPDEIRRNIMMGHDDALNVLENRGKITAGERQYLVNNFRLP